jgi:DMSO reductase anchor subunit
MVYAATRRWHWRGAATGPRFVGTSLLLGEAGVQALSALAGQTALARGLLLLVVVTTLLKLLGELAPLRHLRARQHSVGKRVALLLVRDLHEATVARFLCGAIGGLLIPGLLLLLLDAGSVSQTGVAQGSVAALILLTGGELLERYLFFRAAPASRMPGGLT